MMPRSKKKNGATINKTKEYSVVFVYTKTPHLFSLWLEFFGVERWIKWILTKKSFLLLRFFLMSVGSCVYRLENSSVAIICIQHKIILNLSVRRFFSLFLVCILLPRAQCFLKILD